MGLVQTYSVLTQGIISLGIRTLTIIKLIKNKMINANNLKYTAAAAANVVITAKKAILEGLIIGADVGSSVIEISDSATDGDGNVVIYLAGSTLSTTTGGYLKIGAVFENGITMDITNQTHITAVWKPTV